MSRKYDIMVAGHLCVDIIPRFTNTGAKTIEQIMRPGKLINVAEAKISTGGPVSNTGVNMKTLGCNVCFCARVGDDVLGNLTIDMLEKNGNAQGIHKIHSVASSYTIVIAPPAIDRMFIHNPGANDTFCADDLDPNLIAQCRHFHFGYPPLMAKMFADEGSELRKIFQIAKQAGATTSCDMTLPDPDSESGKAPWRKILEKTLPFIDIFVPSVEETYYMLHPQKFLQMKAEHNNAELIDHFTPENYSQIADEILAMGCKMVTLKSGHRGFYIKTTSKDAFDSLGAAQPGDHDNWSNRELWAPAFKPANFGSATGSGDSSIAGFLTAYLRGLKLEQAVKYATCCGLQNVTVLDAVSGIKSWQETTKMLQADMPMININIKQPDWYYSKDHKLWSGPKDMLSN
ncbi:MAG: carbohydrate kinase family protein [Sedimentisphaerales bacterium]|nr:carbohydrate kinase family protein [Sedimentisphaerales bacterium]